MNHMVTVSYNRAGPTEVTEAGQHARHIITSANAPWTKMSVAELTLSPGQVGNPHNHRRKVTPMIFLASGYPVATLLGRLLDELVWINPGDWGSIGLVDHVCIYPRLHDDMPSAVAYEIRNDGDFAAHTWPVPDKWPLVRTRVEDLGWQDKVTWPADALQAFASHDNADSFPGAPVAISAAPDIIQRPYGD
jgi:hypothetical protein